MKKLSQILAVGVITLTPFVVSSSAFAASTCQIGYTGPDSNNTCVLTETYTCTVTNDNKITVTNENTQDAATGTATGLNNTDVGSSTTGSATNSNGSVFNVTIVNGGEAHNICEVVTTVPATVTPDVPKAVVPAPVGGGGGGAGAVAALPNTSSNAAILGYVAGIVGALGAGAVVSRLAVAAYGRTKSQ